MTEKGKKAPKEVKLKTSEKRERSPEEGLGVG